MPEPLKVFVSHHHSPAEDTFTARLVADLRAAGIDVWVDTDRIPSGDFLRKINEGLTGRQYLVFVMTPDSLKSSYVQMEVNAALHQFNIGRMLGVIPIMAQTCDEGDILPLWSTLQRYDATKGYSACLTQLLQVFGVEPKSVNPSAQQQSAKSASANKQIKGADVKCEMTLSFEEAVRGCQKEVEVPRWETCTVCHGNGVKPGTYTQQCPDCQGAGETRRVQQSIFGQFLNVIKCERCHGNGQIPTTPCERCHGEGRVRSVHRITINIPAGIDDGINVRVTGEGDAPEGGGAPGNLYVHLSVKPHAYFQRQGNNILYGLLISAADAAEGATVDVPTLDGKERLWIPPGTQNGRVFRLEGKGAPVVHSDKCGDEIVTIAIKPWI